MPSAKGSRPLLPPAKSSIWLMAAAPFSPEHAKQYDTTNEVDHVQVGPKKVRAHGVVHDTDLHAVIVVVFVPRSLRVSVRAEVESLCAPRLLKNVMYLSELRHSLQGFSPAALVDRG